jgi:2,4-dienoyl-CoA reductase-like NADH-dependent reductase (Old Yellow Enzyme family)
VSALPLLDAPWLHPHRSLPCRAVCLAEDHGLATLSGEPSPAAFATFIERARGGWGLICLGPVLLAPPSPGSPPASQYTAQLTRRLCAATELHLAQLARLIAAMRAVSEVPIGCQLELPLFGLPGLSEPEEAWTARLASGARALYDIGVRWFTIKDMHIAELVYPLAGLSEDDWWDVVCRVITAVRAALPEDAAVVARVRWSHPPEALELWADRVEALAEAGADVLHVALSVDQPDAFVGGSERASGAKPAAQINARARLPLLYSGRMRHGEDAERVLRFHQVDLVGFGRAALVDPDLLALGRAGLNAMHCTGCMACIPARPATPFLDVGCSLRPTPRPDPHHTLPSALHVFGASFPALVAARDAARAGVPVCVQLVGQTPGGGVRQRGRIPRQAESAEAALHLLDQCRAAGVQITRGALPSAIQRVAGDRVLVSLPPVRRVVPAALAGFAGELVDGRAMVEQTAQPRDAAIVWGAGLLAVELATFLDMQAIPVCIAADAPLCHDTHPALADFLTSFLAERGICVAQARDVSVDAAGQLVVTAIAQARPALAPPWPGVASRLVLADAEIQSHPLIPALLAEHPDAVLLPDPYEPLALRAAMGRVPDALRVFPWS